jgi:peptide-methionine (S)-S-oxide reductase
VGWTAGDGSPNRVRHDALKDNACINHAESVEVLFDPTRVSYQKLLQVFWHNVDPLTACLKKR